jgi:hypothetical protein
MVCQLRGGLGGIDSSVCRMFRAGRSSFDFLRRRRGRDARLQADGQLQSQEGEQNAGQG